MHGPGGLPATKRGVPEVLRYSNVTRLLKDSSSNSSTSSLDDGAVRYSLQLRWANKGLAGVAAGDVVVIDPRIDAGMSFWLHQYGMLEPYKQEWLRQAGVEEAAAAELVVVAPLATRAA